MIYEYDDNKSILNYKKHGIDFETAKKIRNDTNVLEIPAKNIKEERYMVIGKIAEKHWSAIITYRNKNIRIISVRRSRDEEIKIYETF